MLGITPYYNSSNLYACSSNLVECRTPTFWFTAEKYFAPLWQCANTYSPNSSPTTGVFNFVHASTDGKEG